MVPGCFGICGVGGRIFDFGVFGGRDAETGSPVIPN